MSQFDLIEGPHAPALSPLVLSDRLLTLAQQAEHAGYPRAAQRLLGLALRMMEERPRSLRRAAPGLHASRTSEAA